MTGEVTDLSIRSIGVVGAGTMGAGIAQVAAQAGLDVLLHDPFPQALARAIDNIRGWLDRAAAKGRIPAANVAAILERLRPTDSLLHLAAADFVVEAAPEDLELKRRIFGDLDAACPADTILATNTSSLSVTEIGALTSRRDRVVGMHFFNPVPLMALVEVIRGHQTAPGTVTATLEVARRLGKTPVEAVDTPGFIVNRVARPFYSEALRLVGEGVASPERVDACLKAAGFRMGPFELMDLIGVDINFAVTSSVYAQYFNEPRFRPHVLQRKMVQAGMLGRKAGRGFYNYRGGSAEPIGADPVAGETALPPADRPILVVAADATAAAPLSRAAAEAGLPLAVQVWPAPPADVSRAAARAWLCLDLTPGPRPAKQEVVTALDRALPDDALLASYAMTVTATELAAWTGRPGQVLGLGGLPPAGGSGILELAVPVRLADEWAPDPALPLAWAPAGAAFRRMGLTALPLGDGAGMVSARVVACLVNEAAHTRMEGVATADAIDTAMRLGANYPRGPLSWGSGLGLDWVLSVLEHLRADLGDERYRPAPLLRRLAPGR